MEGVSPPPTLAPIHSENSLSHYPILNYSEKFLVLKKLTIGGLGVQKGGQPTKVCQGSLSPARSFRASALVGEAEALMNHTEPCSSKGV